MAKGKHDIRGKPLPPVVDLMGRVVIVHGIYTRTVEPIKNSAQKKSWAVHPLAVPRSGWVVGERWLQTGVHEFGCYDEPAHWTNDGPSFHCLFVSYWPTLKPVPVPFEYAELAPVYAVDLGSVLMSGGGATDLCVVVRKDHAPRPNNTTTWSEIDKIEARTEMAEWPRNEKGHWKKYADFTVEEEVAYKVREEKFRENAQRAYEIVRELQKERGEAYARLKAKALEHREAESTIVRVFGDPREWEEEPT